MKIMFVLVYCYEEFRVCWNIERISYSGGFFRFFVGSVRNDCMEWCNVKFVILIIC